MIDVNKHAERIDPNDIHSAALCAWKEARGEGVEGICGVLWVLKNRVGFPGFAHTLHDVIYGKNQFTSMSVPSDPEFNLEPKPGDMWEAAKGLAENIFGSLELVDNEAGSLVSQRREQDPTAGAHYYANLHNIDKGGWFERNIMKSPDHPITTQILHHTFFL